MKKFFFGLTIFFIIIFLINIGWVIAFLYGTAVDGIQSILQNKDLIESISVSIFFRWILLIDLIWFVFFFVYIIQRRQFKTNPHLHYLKYDPIIKPKICIIIPAYNEEKSIKQVVTDFKIHKFVEHIIVIDNNSSDQTVDIAEKCGVTVIRKTKNKGYAHSYAMGLKEALKTDADVIVTTEADGSYNSYDISKMLSYLDNCDMVIGTRQIQVLTEKDNLRSGMMHVWGNYILAKLIQMKYFSLLHLGILNLTDIGCLFRMMRRISLEKIINQLFYPNSDEPVGGDSFPLFLTTVGIENDLRIVQIPVTFNKRIGASKNQPENLKGLRYGLKFFWFIMTK